MIIRYFPEPDLPPLHFEKEYVESIKTEIPELPEQKKERFIKEYGLDEPTVEIFVANQDLSEYFEEVVSEFEEWTDEEGIKINKLLANYLISDVQGLLGTENFVKKDFKIDSENFAEFIKMIYKGEISSKIAKMVLAEMFNTGVDPSNIVESNNWGQMKDSGELEKIIKELIVKNPKAVADYKSGNKNAIQFLSGQVMGATRGTANPQKVQELLKKLL